MGQSVVKNSRKIFSQASPESVLTNRVTTLENNEYKITYYEIVSGTSGSLTIPTNSTINSDEFGLSGNAILSKIDGSNKPTFESPKTIGDVVVTASLNTTTGAWVASGTYTDSTVALIYSIKIKAIYYSTLNYDRIIETVDLAVTKTSDLINDGDDGISHFITLEDLPSNLTLYATDAASDISGYFKLVTAITDPSYNTTAVNIPTGAITTSNQFIASLATSANVIVGNPGIFNVTTIGNIQKLSGTGNAEFYFEVWKRVAAGTETLITISGSTLPVLNSGYAEFSASALWNDGVFLATDRIVLKYYATRIPTGSDPSYQFQFGGLSPVRSLVPIPLNVTPVLNLDNLQDVDATTPNNNDVLTYESSSQLWKNKPKYQDASIVNQWLTPPFVTKSSQSGGVGVVWFFPQLIGDTKTITEISCEVTTLIAGSNVRIALYDDDGTGLLPSNLVEDSGNLSSATTGLKSFTLSTPKVLNSNNKVYWTAIQISSNSVGIRSGTTVNYFSSASGLTAGVGARVIVQSFGAFPSSGLTSTVNTVAFSYFVHIKKSA